MAATDKAPGILAIWNDVRAGREAEFEAWLQGEHLVERLAVPGFLFGRRYEAISGDAGYFVYYVVETPDVLASPAYLERLNNPTPLTKRIMSEVFLNMNRTVCRRVFKRGPFSGAYAVTVRCNDQPDIGVLSGVADALVKDTRTATAEVWLAADAGAPVSEEERLRGGDKKIKAALMVDTLRQTEAERIGAELKSAFTGADVGVFRVLCQIGQSEA